MSVAKPVATRHAPRRRRLTRRRAVGGFWSAITWLLAIILFFPVFWMVITAFKKEGDAYTDPPRIVFHPTLTEFSQVFSGGAGHPFLHSVFVSLVSVVLVLALALPAAYALAIRPVKRWRDSLFFFLSTKMLPYVAAIVPIYIIAEHTGLLDNDWALVILYTGFNLPLAVWMIRSFFLEVPRELLEAARIDGGGLYVELSKVIMPIVAPGLAATALICVIFTWNEFFFAYFLTATRGPTVPIFLVSFLQSEGEYWARLSAAATAACLPVILAGWIAQKQLVRGLSLGALK
ncbi:MAG TPA: carbohydrate ABC transporter permease [Solirubrobacteraceae bacterium]|jgi:sorbitol/mannitol transport system permease protein|nr:carbohydrate ABC transporter permease [Solirubrobacteraceae bacterium]